jgi:transposase-like protein
MAQQESMTLVEFMKRYSTEEACREHLYQMRWAEGFVCPKCGKKDEPFNIKSRHKYQCKHCIHQTSVTAGTIMDKSRTSLTKWFLAIYLMGHDKRGCSALKLKRELEIAYDTAWTMSHKIRKAMGERDSRYLLGGTVEIDEAFFGGAHAGSKRGRGTDKTPVVFAVSFDEEGYCQFLKAKVLSAVNGQELSSFSQESIEAGSTLQSDGLSAYKALLEDYNLVQEPFNPTENPEHLKWLHIIVSNAKAFIQGTYHGLDSKHLQFYLDEFAFRFGRRFWLPQLFNRILAACASSSKFTRYDLIG